MSARATMWRLEKIVFESVHLSWHYLGPWIKLRASILPINTSIHRHIFSFNMNNVYTHLIHGCFYFNKEIWNNDILNSIVVKLNQDIKYLFS